MDARILNRRISSFSEWQTNRVSLDSASTAAWECFCTQDQVNHLQNPLYQLKVRRKLEDKARKIVGKTKEWKLKSDRLMTWMYRFAAKELQF
jgi:hypothetical protein